MLRARVRIEFQGYALFVVSLSTYMSIFVFLFIRFTYAARWLSWELEFSPFRM